MTPLIQAISASNDLEQDLGDGKTQRVKIIEMLLKADARAIRDLDGNSPLIWAITTDVNLEQNLGGGTTERFKIVEMLLKADVTLINISDPDGKIPLDLAIEMKKYYDSNAIIDILKAQSSTELLRKRWWKFW